jgi:putative ABC transport system permease protein
MTLKLAWANVRRSYKDFAIYFITLLVGVAVFYAFNSIEAQRGVLALSKAQGQMIEMLGLLTDIVSVLITVIMAFLVVYASRFLIKRRNKEFGLYLLLGMQRGRLLRLTAAETLMVGLASLGAGLLLGVGLSQVLVWATAFMFQANMSSAFTFLFAPEIAVRTVVTFCAIFAVSLLINVGYLMRAKLVDLINADRKNEVLTLRSIPVSFALFAASCAIIGFSYHLLLENGLLTADSKFWVATVLVCVGTLLFFYSLSGFLLRFAQVARPVYYRGLNMFVLREIASRVNSTFVSMGVICLTLFLAIASVCGGIGICSAMNNGYRTGYDASMRVLYFSGQQTFPQDVNEQMAQRFGQVGAAPWNTLVKEAKQVDFYESDLTLGAFDALSDKPLNDYVSNAMDGYQKTAVCVVKLSQYNQALQMEGKDPVSLGQGQALVACDMDMMADYYKAVVASGGSVSVYGKTLELAPFVAQESIETTSVATNSGMLVVNDDAVPSGTLVYSSLLNVDYTSADAEEQWANGVEKVAEEFGEDGASRIGVFETKQQVHDQGIGLTTVVSYLAIYIGFVLVVACAAILAIQQLTAASDNRKRYVLLSKLGASKSMLDSALLKQVAIAFLFPLALAVCHSTCALITVSDVVQMFGHIEIGYVAGIASIAFAVVYGAYFLLTFFQARSIVHSGLQEW